MKKTNMTRHNLKLLRVKHNLTQQQLADQLGVSVSTYNLVENGQRRGSQEFWLKLQNLLHLEDGEVWQVQQLI